MIRRSIFSAWASLALLATVPVPARAGAPMVKTQPPAFYRVMIGDFEVTALLDENSPWPEALDQLFPTLSAQEKADLRARTLLQPANDFSTIAFLVNTGSRLLLFDAGGGSTGGYGQLFANLKAAGYTPEQVDDIYLTHMHPDHVGGLSEGAVRRFPNATVHADVHELPQWQAMADKGHATAKTIVAKLAPYVAAQRFQTFSGATELHPGVRAVPAYGHTDGHTFFALERQGQRLVIWGDFVVNDKVQFEKVNAVPPSEKDAASGIALRKATFAEAAKQGTLIAGAHFAFPGLGRLRALEGRYIWVPLDYAALPAPAK